MKLVVFNLLMFGFIFSVQAGADKRVSRECGFVFYSNKAAVNECKDKFDLGEIICMREVLIDIDMGDWFDNERNERYCKAQEKRNALKNILSINSESLREAFREGNIYFQDHSFQEWIENYRDIDSLLISQIESMDFSSKIEFSDQAGVFEKISRECSYIFYSNKADVNECKDKFDLEELVIMRNVLLDIEWGDWGESNWISAYPKALKKILSINSKLLLNIFQREYVGHDVMSVKNWIYKHKDTYPSLTSQIKSALKPKLCELVFDTISAKNLCKESDLDFKEVSLMNYVLKEIRGRRGWGRIYQLELRGLEAKNVLKNILNLSSRPFFKIFEDFSSEEFKSVISWIRDNRDEDPLLTSQIKSIMFSPFLNEQLCGSIFYSTEAVNECSDKFDVEELYQMKDVLLYILLDDWHEIDSLARTNVLKNILSISSKPLLEIFEDYSSSEEFKSVISWIRDNRDEDPLLTSQIESMVSSQIE